MGGKGNHRTCAICGIKERHCDKKLFFARFPSDKDRCKEWVKAVGNEDLAYLPVEKLHDLYHVCEIHFHTRDFTKHKARLKHRAVPKLYLSANPLSEEVLKDFPLQMAVSSKGPLIENVSSLPSTSGQTTQERLPLETTGTQNQHISGPLIENVSSLPSTSGQTTQECLPLETTGIQNLHISGPLQENTSSLPSTSGQTVQESLPVEATASQNQRVSKPLSEKVENTIRKTENAQKRKLAENYSEPPSQKVLKTSERKENSLKRKLKDDCADMTPRKKKLLAQLQKTKYTLASLRKSAKLIEDLASPVLKELVLCALKNRKRKPQGRRWTTKVKVSCLAIFKRSPRNYRYMQHLIPMPSTKTLQNILKKMPMEPGINTMVLKKLNQLTTGAKSLNTKDRVCALVFDEIALKPRILYNGATDKVEGFVDLGGEDGRSSSIADHALVFMLQGVHKKFKQPLAFYFVKGTVSSQKLAVSIKEIITEVEKCGFRIICTVCDQGPTNTGAINLLKSWHNSGDNYFVHNDKEIFFLYDVPHLFKSIRNNFLKQGTLEMDGMKGQWRHLIEVEEQNRNFLFMSKITPLHVQPKYRSKMKVKYAVEILSQTVAVILKLLARDADNRDRKNEIHETALIVEQLNKLFDFTNGPSGPDDVIKDKRQNVSENTKHVEVWKDFLKKLSTLKFIGRNGIEARNVKCVDGYTVTLKTLCSLWSQVKSLGFSYLNLRQLNQDALENFFGLVRQQNPTDKHPTCSAFMGATKSLILSGMTAPHSRKSNCKKDNLQLLTDFHELIFQPGESVSSESEVHDEEDMLESNIVIPQLSLDDQIPLLSLPEKEIDYIELESDLSQLSEQPIVYVSGYIASVLKKQKNCQSCWDCLSVPDPGNNKIYDLIKLREWWADKQSLTYPTINLCRTVEKAMEVFKNEIIDNLYKQNICHFTVTMLYVHCDGTWFNCNKHAKEMLNSLYIRLSLLFIRRQCQRINLNLSLKEEDTADAYKKGQQYGAAK